MRIHAIGGYGSPLPFTLPLGGTPGPGRRPLCGAGRACAAASVSAGRGRRAGRALLAIAVEADQEAAFGERVLVTAEAFEQDGAACAFTAAPLEDRHTRDRLDDYGRSGFCALYVPGSEIVETSGVISNAGAIDNSARESLRF
jgi:hypothetical protein